MKQLLVLLILTWGAMSQVTTNIIAIRVSFKTDSSPFTLGNGQFNLRTLQSLDSIQSIVIDPPPHNKTYFSDHLQFASNYFEKELNTELSYELYPVTENASYTVNHEMFYYNPNNENLNKERYIELYKEAYELALNDGVSIDQDDIVIIFHAGVGNDIYRDFNDSPHDIPSRSLLETEILEFYPNWKLSGRSLKGIVLPETVSQYGFELALNGLIVANIGTQLGLLDLINPEKRSTTAGPWALEDRGLFNANGLLPSVPSAWNRLNYLNNGNLVDSIALGTKNATLNVKSYHALAANKAYIKIPLNRNEFYLIENREREIYNNDAMKSLDQLIDDFTPEGEFFLNYKQILTHPDFSHKSDFTFAASGVLVDAKNFDAAIPHSGLIVWKIDQQILDEKKAKNRINDDALRPAVKLIEADGVFNYNSGGDGFNDERFDVFYAGNEASYYQNQIHAESFPNTNSDYEFSESGIRLSNFSNAAEVMSFDYENPTKILELEPGINHVFIDSLESLILYESTDSVRIYCINNIVQKTIKAVFHKSKFNYYEIQDMNSSELFSKNGKNLKRYNYVADQSDDYLFDHNIDSLFFYKKQYYVKAADDLFYLNSMNSFVKISDDIEKIFFFDNSVLAKKSNDYYLLENKALHRLNIEHEADMIKKQSSYYSLSLSDNLYALKFNDVLAYDYPKAVFYRQRNGSLKRMIWKANAAVTIDDENIVKYFNPYQSSNKFTNYYLGDDILDINFFASDSPILKAFTQNTYFQYDLPLLDASQENTVNRIEDAVINDKATFLWPNPADQSTSIRLLSTVSGLCKLKVYNDIGEFLFKDEFNAIKNEAIDFQLNTSNYSNGSYLVLIEIAGKQKLLKMAVIH